MIDVIFKSVFSVTPFWSYSSLKPFGPMIHDFYAETQDFTKISSRFLNFVSAPNPRCEYCNTSVFSLTDVTSHIGLPLKPSFSWPWDYRILTALNGQHLGTLVLN